MTTTRLIALIIFAAASIYAADNAVTIDRTTTGGFEVKVGGKPFASYVIDQANKPYLWPIYGPTGKQMTRACSSRYPTGWHVRSYGLFAANPFASRSYAKSNPRADYEVKAGERLKLRHRFLLHKGNEKAAKIAEAFEADAK